MSEEVNSLYYKAQNYDEGLNSRELEGDGRGANQSQFSIKDSLILGHQQRSQSEMAFS